LSALRSRRYAAHNAKQMHCRIFITMSTPYVITALYRIMNADTDPALYSRVAGIDADLMLMMTSPSISYVTSRRQGFVSLLINTIELRVDDRGGSVQSGV